MANSSVTEDINKKVRAVPLCSIDTRIIVWPKLGLLYCGFIFNNPCKNISTSILLLIFEVDE